VAIVDAGRLLANQAIHRLNDRAATHHRDRLGADSHVNCGSDQATWNRVGVGAYIDRTALADANPLENIVGIQSLIGQRMQRLLLFGKAFGAPRVGVIDDSLHELHVFISTAKLMTSSKQECLFDAIFEVTVL
jgi:hypothetical protein